MTLLKSLLIGLLLVATPTHAVTSRVLTGTAIKNGSGLLNIPTSTPTASRVAKFDGSSVIAGSTVTSAALETAFGSQTQNYVWAAPSGSSSTPSFRLLDPTDIPSLASSKITTGTWGETRGGTNQTTYATGDTLYSSASNTLSKLAAGTPGQVYTQGATIPAWSFGTYQSKTGNYTLLNTDTWAVGDASGGAFSFTFPAASGVAGKVYRVKKIDTSTGIITLARTGSDVFNYQGTTTTSLTLNTVNEEWEIGSDGSATYYVLNHKTDTKEVAFTPTLTWTDNLGTNTATWVRRANKIIVNGYIDTSGTPSTGGNLTATIPNNASWTIDTASLNTSSGDYNLVGVNKLLDTGSAWYGMGSVSYKSTTTVIFYNANTASTGRAVAVTNAVPFTFGGSDAVFYEYSVPITGWYP